MNWTRIAFDSHYIAAEEVLRALAVGDVEEAKCGLQELIEAMARSERRAVRSQLTRLMKHILKWNTQPKRRSKSWVSTIYSARDEIEASQEEVPSINRAVIEAMWDKCFATAAKQAQMEMDQPPALKILSWEQVFVDDYPLSNV